MLFVFHCFASSRQFPRRGHFGPRVCRCRVQLLSYRVSLLCSFLRLVCHDVLGPSRTNSNNNNKQTDKQISNNTQTNKQNNSEHVAIIPTNGHRWFCLFGRSCPKMFVWHFGVLQFVGVSPQKFVQSVCASIGLCLFVVGVLCAPPPHFPGSFVRCPRRCRQHVERITRNFVQRVFPNAVHAVCLKLQLAFHCIWLTVC